MKLSLKKRVEPVEFELQDGSVLSARIEELSGKDRDQYLDEMNKSMEFKNGEPARLKSFENVQALLLSRCLIKDGDDTRFTMEEIQEMPSSVVHTLFEAAQNLNGLSEAGVARSKNV